MSTFLMPNDKTFERSITRNSLHKRSQELNWLIAALRDVQNYGATRKEELQRYADALLRLGRAISAWEKNHPEEIARRGNLLPDLKRVVEHRARSMQLKNPMSDDQPVSFHTKQTWHDTAGVDFDSNVHGLPVNRWSTMKMGMKVGSSAGGAGISVAQLATGATLPAATTAVAAGTVAATVGTGGVALAAAGLAFVLGPNALAARSAYKTNEHLKNLRSIAINPIMYSVQNSCKVLPGDPSPRNTLRHEQLFDIVLPYLIDKKGAKFLRKTVSAVPFFGLAENLRAVAKNGYKRWQGTLGSNREKMSFLLTEHFLTHNCGLAIAIISDLYSREEMEWMKWQEFGLVHALLCEKFKST